MTQSIFDVKLIYWSVQAMLALIATGWIAVSMMYGDMSITLIASFLLVLYAILSLKAALGSGLLQMRTTDRIAVSCIAVIFSLFNMAGILMNFVPMLGAHEEHDELSITPIAYVGLFASALVFFLFSFWPGSLEIRGLVAAVLALVTAGLATAANATAKAGKMPN